MATDDRSGSDDMFASADANVDRPNAARMYDYFLGGAHNFSADRQAAERAIAIEPEFPLIMRANRAFLDRAVRFMLGEGIGQFLDIGSGLPTVGNVHEIAHGADQASTVVYVDVDPIAVEHSRSLLADNPRATAIRGDLRHPASVLHDADATRLIDWSRPVGLLMVAVLHFVPDDDQAAAAVAAYRDAVAADSCLAISHAGGFVGHDEQVARLVELYRATPTPIVMRSTTQLCGFFTGWDVVPPGVVRTERWRPDTDVPLAQPPDWMVAYAAVARRPARVNGST